MEIMPIIRELGSAGATVVLAVWVIQKQDKTLQDVARAMAKLEATMDRAIEKITN